MGTELKILSTACSLTGKAFTGCFRLIKNAAGTLGTNKALRNLEKYNRYEKRVVNVRQPVTAAAFAASLPADSSVLISGNDQESESDGSWKNELAAGLARSAHSNGYHLVFLSMGNLDLSGRLQLRFPENQLLFLENGNQLYDPLREYSIEDCVAVLMRNALAKYSENEAGQRYLEGIIQLFEWGYGRRPYLKAINEILEKDHGFLANLAQSALDNNKLSYERYTVIDGNLTGGLSGRYKLKTYLKDLYHQVSGFCLQANIQDGSIFSLRRAVNEDLIPICDLSQVTNAGMVLGLIVNELDYLVANGEKVMLFIDEQAVEKCETLLNMLRMAGTRFRWCVISRDFFAQCGGESNLFSSLVGKSFCNVVMRHENGISAQGWQNQLGTYTRKDVTMSIQSGKSYTMTSLFGSKSVSEGYTVADKQEYKVKAEEIQTLPPGNAFIQRKGTDIIERVFFSES